VRPVQAVARHEVRSKIRNSSIFSSGVANAPVAARIAEFRMGDADLAQEAFHGIKFAGDRP
jgi:hypothetical protein